jgi:hypothetical protein
LVRFDGCRACCAYVNEEHDAGEGCTQCPYQKAGELPNFVYKIFRLACTRNTDHKTQDRRWYLDTDRMMFAYATYDIIDKERIFSLVTLALQILNGEDEIIVTDPDEIDE